MRTRSRAHVGERARLVEFGSGAGIKIRLLLSALERPAAYVPVDISRLHLLAAASSLAKDFPQLAIAPICADYTQPFALPPVEGARYTVGFFPGSTIGNFTTEEAQSFPDDRPHFARPGLIDDRRGRPAQGRGRADARL